MRGLAWPVLLGVASVAVGQTAWNGLGGEGRHWGVSSVRGQPLERILWTAPVDLNPQYSGESLLAHYGSPCITAANTVIFPVKQGAADGFKIEGRSGVDGKVIWKQNTAYSVPPHGWFPLVGPALLPPATSGGTARVIFPDSGGRVTIRGNADGSPSSTKTIAFYGNANYAGDPLAYDANVKICTPLTTDAEGNTFFGYIVLGDTPLNFKSGIAKIAADGTGSYVEAARAANDPDLRYVKQNGAPALSNSGKVLYLVVSAGNWGRGRLLGLDVRTLKTYFSAPLIDPSNGNFTHVDDAGTAAPVVAPGGDVYVGSLENPFGSNHARGWLQHFSSDLKTVKAPGAFGWDDTPSIVRSSLLPWYNGTSKYLIFAKYNNYVQGGGDGLNKMAILDPEATMVDPISGATVMNEVAVQPGITPDAQFLPDFPLAVREWCVNAGVVDPFNRAIYMNSEDGKVYRWNLVTNTLDQSISMNGGIGQAYTCTLIGPDGHIYAINAALLHCIGKAR